MTLHASVVLHEPQTTDVVSQVRNIGQTTYFNGGERYKDMNDHLSYSYAHSLSSCDNL